MEYNVYSFPYTSSQNSHRAPIKQQQNNTLQNIKEDIEIDVLINPQDFMVSFEHECETLVLAFNILRMN